MHTWKIAKILVENCTSPEDVDEVIQLLSNALAIQDICWMLTAFSNSQSLPSSPQARAGKGQQSDSCSSQPKSRNTKGLGAGKGLDDDSEVAQAFQLETLLKASGKTNRQIEQWMSENFNVRAVVGKGSLRLYLARVLRKADLSLRNRILGAAQSLVGKDSPGTSDIKDYWDELEKRYIPSDVND